MTAAANPICCGYCYWWEPTSIADQGHCHSPLLNHGNDPRKTSADGTDCPDFELPPGTVELVGRKT